MTNCHGIVTFRNNRSSPCSVSGPVKWYRARRFSMLSGATRVSPVRARWRPIGTTNPRLASAGADARHPLQRNVPRCSHGRPNARPYEQRGREFATVILRNLFADIAATMRTLHRDRVAVRTRLSKALPEVIGNSTRLRQALLNVCENAWPKHIFASSARTLPPNSIFTPRPATASACATPTNLRPARGRNG